MNDASPIPVAESFGDDANGDVVLTGRERAGLYFAVGLGAGSVIALQIDIMRVFSVGSWAHFGSLVVSLAMLGFGLTSAVMTVAKDWFSRHWRLAATVALGLFGPLAVAANLYVQRLGFNAIFLVSDPAQKWKLLEMFLAELTPFLAGAVFLGSVFLKSNRTFGRVYFADLAGSGLCGLIFLLAMYVFVPANLIAAPLALWLAACVAWAAGPGGPRALVPFLLAAALAFAGHFSIAPALGLKTLAVNDYKGVSYARKFPDAKKVYESASPFGYLEIYSSSYLHFAPGLSDNAGFNLPTMPANAYLGLYIDSDGPIGIMRDLTDKETAYFRFLPMVYPYVIKSAPKTFITQFGGGISTEVALHSGARDVTVAEGNRAVLEAFRSDVIRKFTGDILSKVHVIDYEGRHFLAHTDQRFDVIDLSLADLVGLSNPGGFAIVEKFSYTKEAMETYMRALAPGGVLSVTLWNKEEPPKSVLKLYATMAAAARDVDPGHMANSFFVVSTYLSTATVLYKNGGFTPDEVAKLRRHTRDMSFDEIYSPGFAFDPSQTDATLKGYVEQIFGDAAGGPPSPNGSQGATEGSDQETDAPPSGKADDSVLPATSMGRLAWHALMSGTWPDVAARYVFNARTLTNDFAVLRGLCEDPRSAEGPRSARTAARRVGLSADLGDARGRHSDGDRPARHSRHLGLADHLLAQPRQGADGALLRLPRRRLHHGGGWSHRRFRDGARQSDDFRLGADYGHAGLFGTRGADFGARPAAHAHAHAGPVPRDRRAPHPLRAVHQSGSRLDRRPALRRAPRLLLHDRRPAGVPDGLPNADCDDDAWTTRQESHVHLGVGRQWLLLRDRGGGRSGYCDQLRPRGSHRNRRFRVSISAARVFWRGRCG